MGGDLHIVVLGRTVLSVGPVAAACAAKPGRIAWNNPSASVARLVLFLLENTYNKNELNLKNAMYFSQVPGKEGCCQAGKINCESKS